MPSTAAATAVQSFLQDRANELSIQSTNVWVIAFLVITAILLINSVEYALNEVWQVFEPRRIADRIMIFCSIILIGPVLAVSAFYFIKKKFEPFLADFGAWSSVDTAYRYLFPFLIDFLAFVSLYYLIPKAAIKFRSACFGAFFAAILFGFAKVTFVVYVEQFASYGAVYAAVASIPIFLTWLYLAWMIVLVGAELSYQAQHLPRHGDLWKRSFMSVGDGLMLLSVQALVIVARAFQKGQEMPNELEIAERIGCSSVVLKPGISALEKVGIIARGDSRDMPIMLMRDPSKVSLKDIREALFEARSCMHFPAEIARLFGYAAREEEWSTKTLADVAQMS
jgi:membrane protein